MAAPASQNESRSLHPRRVLYSGSAPWTTGPNETSSPIGAPVSGVSVSAMLARKNRGGPENWEGIPGGIEKCKEENEAALKGSEEIGWPIPIGNLSRIRRGRRTDFSGLCEEGRTPVIYMANARNGRYCISSGGCLPLRRLAFSRVFSKALPKLLASAAPFVFLFTFGSAAKSVLWPSRLTAMTPVRPTP